ncbi:MAG: hypothetical protein AAGJ52_00520 [Pseudomonadota bacterium]
MNTVRSAILLTSLAFAANAAFAQVEGEEQGAPANDRFPASSQLSSNLFLRDAQGLPGVRPRMSLSLPIAGNLGSSTLELDDRDIEQSAFSWSLEAWQLNTASLAHIQCAEQSVTANAFLASDCRFVDQPTPDNAINLVQVRGEWMAAPNFRVGMGAFVNPTDGELATSPVMLGDMSAADYLNTAGGEINAANVVDGMDINLSFGIQTQHVGDFLIGLQLARYRQRMSLGDLAYGADPLAALDPNYREYAHSAQLALGWQLGNFRTDVMGQHREAPMLFTSGYSPAEFSSFDLEFSWQPRNGSLSIGVSNVLNAQPRSDSLDNAGRDEQLDGVFGRIPYVRYKHDL